MRIVVAAELASAREYMRQAALSIGLECGDGDCVSPNELAVRLESNDADLAVVALGPGVTGAFRFVTPVFVVVGADSTTGLPELLKAGATGYLRKENLRGDLYSAVQQLRSGRLPKLAQGQVFALTAGLLGAGVTTVATNLAFSLAEKHPHRVVLAQFTDGTADLALNLALSPPYPLSELAAGWHCLNGEVMRQCLVDHPAGLSVLADQSNQADPPLWSAVAIRQLLGVLRSRFDFVVLDLGHIIDEPRQEALRLSDAVGVVQRLDVPAMQIGKNWIDRLREIGVSRERLLNIANRVGQRELVSWSTAQDVLDGNLSQAILDDPTRANMALNTGLPITQFAGSTPIGQCFVKLADHWKGHVGRDQTRCDLAEAS